MRRSMMRRAFEERKGVLEFAKGRDFHFERAAVQASGARFVPHRAADAAAGIDVGMGNGGGEDMSWADADTETEEDTDPYVSGSSTSTAAVGTSGSSTSTAAVGTSGSSTSTAAVGMTVVAGQMGATSVDADAADADLAQQLGELLLVAVRAGCEGLMCKRLGDCVTDCVPQGSDLLESTAGSSDGSTAGVNTARMIKSEGGSSKGRECEGEGGHVVGEYEPSTGAQQRSSSWVKLKKDYVDGMGDSFDLVPIGGWTGQGRKGKWVSPWLLACWNPLSDPPALQSVCRVMSGFTDAFYRANTALFRDGGGRISEGGGPGGAGSGGGGDEAEGEGGDEIDRIDIEGYGSDDGVGDRDGGLSDDGEPTSITASIPGSLDREYHSELLLDSPYHTVETGEVCEFWFKPAEVWEIRAADITISPVHAAGMGLVHPSRGMSLRFPRFIRKRTDKQVEHATTAQQIADIFKAQAQRK
jgi:DNA ligase-1